MTMYRLERVVSIVRNLRMAAHTKGGHNLSLQAELLLEARDDIVDSTSSIASDIGYLADVIKHVTTDEQQDNHEGNGSPEVAALKNGRHVGPSNDSCGKNSKHGSDGDYPAYVIDRPLDAGMRSVREGASEPGLNSFGGCGSGCVSPLLFSLRPHATHPVLKS